MSAQKPSPLSKYDGKISLSEIFNKEVTRALKDYPHLRGKFAFINNADGSRIYDVDPELSGFRSQRELDRYLNDLAVFSRGKGPLSTKDPDANLNVIAYSPLPMSLFTRGADSAQKEALALFDHELGHLVVKGSMASQDPCYRECAADVFSIIRHMQRYDSSSDIVGIIGWRRAFDFVMSGRSEHFTTLAIDELERLKDKIDFKEMSPEQIKNLAMRIALAHTPHPDISNGVSRTFDPVRQTLQQTRGNLELAMRTLAEITLDHKDDYHVFKIGNAVLQSFLDGKISNNKGPMLLTGPFWDDVRRDLKEQADNLAKNHILMGMPMHGQPLPEQSDTKKPAWKSVPPPAVVVPPVVTPQQPPANNNPPPPAANNIAAARMRMG